METASPSTSKSSARVAVSVCGLLLVLFAFLSYSSALQKSATYDEPYHALSSWVHLHRHDFRIDYENPPIPHYWGAMLSSEDSLALSANDPLWTAMPADPDLAWDLATKALYRTPGNNGMSVVNRCRFMLVVAGVALGVLVIVWGWRLRGPASAIVAATLFAFDPTLLAHASLVKNDVPMALMMTAVCFTLWCAGRRLGIYTVVALGSLLPLALCTKFSAVLLVPMILGLLLIRVLTSDPWNVLGRAIANRSGKSAAALVLLVWISLTSGLGIWAIYGFRFSPTPDPSIELNTQLHRSQLLYYRFQAEFPHPRPLPFDPFASPTQHLSELQEHIATVDLKLSEARSAIERHAPPEQMRDELQKDLADAQGHLAAARTAAAGLKSLIDPSEPATQSQSPEAAQQLMSAASIAYGSGLDLQKDEYLLRFAEYCAQLPDNYRDLPESCFLFALKHRLLPSAWLHGLFMQYACSRVRGTFLLGKLSDTGWWYYFPLAMLFKTPVASIVAVVLAGMIGAWVVVKRTHDRQIPPIIWPAACVILPAGIYMLTAMTSALNIGIRHVTPVFPLLYIATGVLFGIAMQKRRPAMLAIVSILGIMLACETLSAWPNYIAYFNFAAGGSSNGINLLGDSNLDWGQDLPALAKWQQAHPGVPLALNYFGTADPRSYGIQSDPLTYWPPHPSLRKTHVMALSVTLLQGVYGSNFIGYRQLKPTEILGGGTIYLYDERNAP